MSAPRGALGLLRPGEENIPAKNAGESSMELEMASAEHVQGGVDSVETVEVVTGGEELGSEHGNEGFMESHIIVTNPQELMNNSEVFLLVCVCVCVCVCCVRACVLVFVCICVDGCFSFFLSSFCVFSASAFLFFGEKHEYP